MGANQSPGFVCSGIRQEFRWVTIFRAPAWLPSPSRIRTMRRESLFGCARILGGEGSAARGQCSAGSPHPQPLSPVGKRHSMENRRRGRGERCVARGAGVSGDQRGLQESRS